MKITCQACGAKYTIADDKVRGRKVKIRCKGCSAPIVVDAAQQQAQADATPADTGASDLGSEALDTAGQSVPPPADGWSVNLSDTDQRTMTTEEIVAGFKSGLVTPDAFVWKEGMGDWAPVLECAELKPLLEAAKPAATPAAPAVTPFAAPAAVAAAAPAAAAPAAAGARLAGGRAPAAVDLFGGVANAGSEEEEVATSAPSMGAGAGAGAAMPLAGSTAYDDGKMTGARNENSVLFSLDSLKAGGPAAEPAAATKKAAPSAPRKAGAPPRPGAASTQPSDPFGMGGSNDLMNIGGGGNPLFTMNNNAALLTAPAAPEPPPPRSTDLGLSGPTSFSSPTQKKGKGMIIGAVVGVLALIGIAIFALSGGSKEEAKDAAASATAEAAATAEAPKPEEKKEEPNPAETAKTEPSSAPATAATSAAPADTSKPASGTTPSTPAAGKTPSTTAPAAKKEEEAPAPVSNAGPFSISAAQAALGSAAASAGSCKKPGGPTGAGKVQVTFAPSGRVTSATVNGPPFAGTPVGGCVASMFRRAKVPPFNGSPVTVSKSFSVN